MFYVSTCLTGGHALWEDISYGCTCLMGGHALWDDMSYRITFLLGAHVHWNICTCFCIAAGNDGVDWRLYNLNFHLFSSFNLRHYNLDSFFFLFFLFIGFSNYAPAFGLLLEWTRLW